MDSSLRCVSVPTDEKLNLGENELANETRIIKHPGQNFTIIVNPSNGPGADLYPSDDYVSQIEKLNTLSNACILGYIHTSYAQRDVQSVLKDVAIYSGWAKGNFDATAPGFAVQGIFVDEVPSLYSPEVAKYLKTINLAIKDSPGILGKKVVSTSLVHQARPMCLHVTSQIIHNPGQVPDNRFSDTNTDTTVVFEESYQSFQLKETELAGLSQERSRNSYLIHSLPSSMSKEDLRALLAKASQTAGFLFVTNLDHNYFESFGSSWSTFINAMPT